VTSVLHAACERCYSKHDRRWLPSQLHTALTVEMCCFCAAPTRARLYTQRPASDVPCRGLAGIHEQPAVLPISSAGCLRVSR
jgi:hypothetical protein